LNLFLKKIKNSSLLNLSTFAPYIASSIATNTFISLSGEVHSRCENATTFNQQQLFFVTNEPTEKKEKKNQQQRIVQL